jgi:RNA polymerase sigma-70 factor (ECF subfamily)
MMSWLAQFGELTHARYRGLVAYARLLTGDPESAQDLVHDALVRVFGKTRRFPTAGHAEAYVKRAIVSIFIDGRRRESGTLRVFSRLTLRDEVPDHGIGIDTRDEVHVALLSLSPRERACIVMRYYDDLGVADVAEVLGISVGATKRYLGDGRNKLAARLGDLSPDAAPAATVVAAERSPR